MLFQTRCPQDTFPLPNSGLGARSSFGQKTEPVLRRSRQYIRLDSLNPDLRCAKHRYWSQPIDFGHYNFTPQEKADFLEKEPQAEKYFYRLSGGREFLNGIERWVLWLGEITLQDLQQMPMVRERIEAVRERRSSVKRRQTREAANTPHRFGMEVIPEGNSLIVPQTSSERRRYIPLGFTGKGTLYTQKTMLIPGATLYQFGILHSRVHNAWMRAVGGRMK